MAMAWNCGSGCGSQQRRGGSIHRPARFCGFERDLDGAYDGAAAQRDSDLRCAFIPDSSHHLYSASEALVPANIRWDRGSRWFVCCLTFDLESKRTIRPCLCVALAHEIGDRRIGSGERFFVGQENDAEMFCSRTLAETGAVHDRHMFLANQFGDEDLVAFRDVDARVGVECSARRHATYTRSFGAPLHGQIAAAAQFALD